LLQGEQADAPAAAKVPSPQVAQPAEVLPDVSVASAANVPGEHSEQTASLAAVPATL
jgi:hypothetical protein